MSRKKFVRNLALTSSILVAGVTAGFAQKAEKTPPNQDPTNNVRNVRPEVKEVYKKWIKNDVAYIITAEEKKAFNQLKTDEERENFIENFGAAATRIPIPRKTSFASSITSASLTPTNISLPEFRAG
jgi:hypothetical protein